MGSLVGKVCGVGLGVLLLVIKVGGEVLSAVAVAEALRGDHLVMALPADMRAEESIESVGRE